MVQNEGDFLTIIIIEERLVTNERTIHLNGCDICSENVKCHFNEKEITSMWNHYNNPGVCQDFSTLN